jgi:type IV secretory pathway VirB4 component
MPNKLEAASTQQFIEIEGVEHGTLVLRGGSLRKVLIVSGVNFDLKSEAEQEALIGGFQNFLNSLDFSVQILVHSRKLNIDRYLESLVGLEGRETNELLKRQIAEYREFIRGFVAENAIMAKTFFIVVPFEPIHLPTSGANAAGKLFGFLKKKGVPEPTGRIGMGGDPREEIQKNIEQLEKRTASVVAGLNQMDLRAIPLNDEELVELFYNLYNPAAIEKRNLEIVKERSNQ